MNQYDIAILGGDGRIACMAPIFASQGFRVICYGTTEASRAASASSLREALDTAGVVICGIPFTKEGNLYCENQSVNIPLAELQRCLRKHQKLFGGVIPADFRRLCEEREIGCYDFMLEEPLTLFNAVATAEGAILEALIHKETLLHKSDCLVLGYGRCGSLIAQRLRGMQAHVTVGAGKALELAQAETKGFDTLPLARLPLEISRFDYIFNTIPACYLNAACIRQMRRDVLVIDIASGKTGLDYSFARDLPLNIRYCPGLPGKYASISCGEQLVKYVLRNISPSSHSNKSYSKKKGV